MASAVVVYLRKLLRFTNYLLLFYGLAIIIVAAEFYFEWNSGEHPTTDDDASSSLVDDDDDDSDPLKSYKEIAEKEPVFLYLFFAIGVYVTLVSWTGLWGVESPRNRCCLPFYAHNLLFMWVCSIVATVVAFSETARDFVGAEHEHSIKDITGATKKMYDAMSENLFVVQIMSLLLVFVQTASLVLTAALRKAAAEYSSSAFEDSDDEDETESLFFGNKNRNSGGSANFRDVESSGGGDGGGRNNGDDEDEDESWSERMKMKYGVDVSKYAHSPARPPPSHNAKNKKKKKYPGQSTPELAEKANFCGVM